MRVNNYIIVLCGVTIGIVLGYMSYKLSEAISDIVGEAIVNEQVYKPPAEGILLDEASMGMPLLGIAENGDYEFMQVTEQGYLLCEDVDKNVFKLVPREEEK